MMMAPARVGEGLRGRGHGIEDVVVDLALLFRLHPVIWIETILAAARDWHRDLAGQIRYVERIDLAGAALAVQKAAPTWLDAAGKRRDQAEPCDNYPAHYGRPCI